MSLFSDIFWYIAGWFGYQIVPPPEPVEHEVHECDEPIPFEVKVFM